MRPARTFEVEAHPPTTAALLAQTPPAASAGLSEEAARARFGEAAVKVFGSRFNPMVQALAAEKRQTVMKLVCAGENQAVVGCHIVGEGADEMLQGFAVAMEMVHLPFTRPARKSW